MSWGTELWDQFNTIADHTQKGIDFCEKYAHFIKERCAIENEYAAKLKKLVKNYKPKKSEDEEFTCLRGFYRMLNELHDLAGQHEGIAECLSASIFKELQTLVSELKTDRKKYLDDGAKQQRLLKSQLDQLEKTKKQYEKAFKESEKQQENFKKADADIHLSRADVEKAKALMHARMNSCESCKSEYAAELQKTNTTQNEHYSTTMPEIFSQLQSLEEKRVNTIQDFIKQSADIERRTMPIINTCIDGVINASQSINAVEDSKIVIEKYKSGFTPPSDFPFEDLSNGNISENQNHSSGTPKTLRDKGTIGGKKKKDRGGFLDLFSGKKQSFKDTSPGNKRNGLWRKTSVKKRRPHRTDDSKEDYSHLPPNQQKKKLNEKIENIKQDITKETAERDGMLKMRDVYSQNSKLGDPTLVDRQLEQNAQKLDNMRKELQKYEGYLAETENRNLNVSRGNSMAHRVSDASLSSSTGARGSNPGTPKQTHQAIEPANPVATRESTVSQPHDDSFDDLDEDVDDYDLSAIGTCVALYPFEAPNEGSIAMREGEEFTVLEQDQGDGWTRVKRSSGEVGFVPTSYIKTSF